MYFYVFNNNYRCTTCMFMKCRLLYVITIVSVMSCVRLRNTNVYNADCWCANVCDNYPFIGTKNMYYFITLLNFCKTLFMNNAVTIIYGKYISSGLCRPVVYARVYFITCQYVRICCYVFDFVFLEFSKYFLWSCLLINLQVYVSISFLQCSKPVCMIEIYYISGDWWWFLRYLAPSASSSPLGRITKCLQ